MSAARISRLENVLGTLITWVAQSSVSPISFKEAEELLKMLQDESSPKKRCKNHPDKPMRENLDGDNLCQECCVNWAKAEGRQ